MARIRSVHPDFLRSEEVSFWDPWAQIAFVKIWTEMDDEGRILANSRLLASVLFPYNDDQTAERLEGYIRAWEESGSVCRYTVDVNKLLHVLSWKKWQRPQKPTPSKLPACPMHSSNSPTVGVAEPSGTEGRGGGVEKEKEGESERALRARGRSAPNCSLHLNHPNPPSCPRCKRARLDYEKRQLDATPALAVVPDFMRGKV